MNSVSSDILSVRDAKFSDLLHYFFLIFSVKLGEHKRRKVIEPDFSGKFLFGQKMGKKGPKREKIGFLDAWLSFLGIDSLIFSDSVHEVRGPCGIVRDRARFFWKNLIF